APAGGELLPGSPGAAESAGRRSRHRHDARESRQPARGRRRMGARAGLLSGSARHHGPDRRRAGQVGPLFGSRTRGTRDRPVRRGAALLREFVDADAPARQSGRDGRRLADDGQDVSGPETLRRGAGLQPDVARDRGAAARRAADRRRLVSDGPVLRRTQPAPRGGRSAGARRPGRSQVRAAEAGGEHALARGAPISSGTGPAERGAMSTTVDWAQTSQRLRAIEPALYEVEPGGALALDLNEEWLLELTPDGRIVCQTGMAMDDVQSLLSTGTPEDLGT